MPYHFLKRLYHFASSLAVYENSSCSILLLTLSVFSPFQLWLQVSDRNIFSCAYWLFINNFCTLLHIVWPFLLLFFFWNFYIFCIHFWEGGQICGFQAFSPSMLLFFWFSWVFWKQRFLILVKSSLSCFSFLVHAFLSYLQSCVIQSHKILSRFLQEMLLF